MFMVKGISASAQEDSLSVLMTPENVLEPMLLVKQIELEQ